MQGQKLYSTKSMCQEFGLSCHNTKNRVIEKMAHYECSEKRKMLGKYLKCLMTMEKLCEYICTCCCEMENLTASIISELKQRCSTLKKCCENLMKHMDSECYKYINCDRMLKFCKMVMKLNTSKSKKKSKRK
tara:strand:+ start:151 stop:546 length:396 start_codon:yes stop_codon:yes gene_type:complete